MVLPPERSLHASIETQNALLLNYLLNHIHRARKCTGFILQPGL